MALTLKVRSTPSNDLVHLNLVYVGPTVFPGVQYIVLNNYVFSVSPHQDVKADEIALNTVQRKCARVSLLEEVRVEPYSIPKKQFVLDSLTIEVDYVTKKNSVSTIDGPQFMEVFRKKYLRQVFTVGQTWVMDFEGTNYLLTALDVAIFDEETMTVASTALHERHMIGLVGPDTKPLLKVAQPSAKLIKLINMPLSTASRGSEMFKKDFNFERLGIGGLSVQFGNIFRRAFASRIFPPSVVQGLGINHIKGILLYGPPGTGKTLMARQIGKMLNCKEPKIVNGPEILNKFVGQSEENVRKLFEEAERDQREKGDDSDLHLIIFDEIDAICKARGSTRDSTGVSDSVVNQLLSKIDGVEALNNVLLIGMTNRKDMLDEALMRPGRFEVLIEIGLPNEEGRLQIFTIHTKRMRDNKFMDADVDLAELAKLAKNFSGAEIEGLVKSATSFAFNRQVDVNNLTKPINPEDIRVNRADFLHALEEVKPAFGVDEDELKKYISGDLFDYGPSWRTILDSGNALLRQLERNQHPQCLAALLEGPRGTGKTTVAAHLAMLSGYPYVKVVSAESIHGYSEASKCGHIRKMFDDAYKTPKSIIILDDLERLVEYVPIGPRFSNAILQTLLVFIKKQPPNGKLLVLCTATNSDILDSLELSTVFNATIPILALSQDLDEIESVMRYVVGNSFGTNEKAILQLFPKFIAFKTLKLVCDMASSTADGTTPTEDDYRKALEIYGIHRN